MASTVGFVGLGIMGGPMAANLVQAGFDVVGYNRSRAKVDRLIEAGGRGAASAAEAARDRDVVISMLPDSPDVEAFALGDGGALAQGRPGSLYIDMSTVRPATAMALAEAGRTRGIGVLDAPVSGGERGAIEGTLSIMVGGAHGDVAAARPVLDAMGSTVVHVGAAGAGQTVKAANQLLTAVTIEAVAEAVVSSRRTASTRQSRSERSPGARRKRGARPAVVLHGATATSRPASGARCTTRTWGSSPRPRARRGWSSRWVRRSPN